MSNLEVEIMLTKTAMALAAAAVLGAVSVAQANSNARQAIRNIISLETGLRPNPHTRQRAPPSPMIV